MPSSSRRRIFSRRAASNAAAPVTASLAMIVLNVVYCYNRTNNYSYQLRVIHPICSNITPAPGETGIESAEGIISHHVFPIVSILRNWSRASIKGYF